MRALQSHIGSGLFDYVVYNANLSGSSDIKPEWNVSPVTLDQEAQIADAIAALRYLRTQVPGKPIFVIGHSEGGMMAPLVAERTGATAGVVVINAAQFPIDELVIAQVQAGGAPQDYVDGLTKVFARLKDGSFPAKGQLLGAGQNYWKQWIKYSTESTATPHRPTTPASATWGCESRAASTSLGATHMPATLNSSSSRPAW